MRLIPYPKLTRSEFYIAEKYLLSLTGVLGTNGDVLGAPEGKVLGEITNQKPMNASLTNNFLIDELWNILTEVYPPSKRVFNAA
ncbi:hypothetical protein [Lutimonas sp.]|uniref:hypothetical protein n=1 Tax=Lutimonas sp. TaxID=1872403 RepID=UPI003D9B9F9B